VGYDIALWKSEDEVDELPGVIFLTLGEALPCECLAVFPRDGVSSALRREFGDDFEDEFDGAIDDRHLSVSISFSAVDHWLASLSRIAREFGLVLYDPQVDELTQEELIRFQRHKNQVLRSAESERVLALSRGAESGDVEAMCELGSCLAMGDGTAPDATQAARWYGRASDEGYLPATYNLADCYRTGDGVPHDPDEAIRLYLQAGSRGFVQALTDVARHLRFGSGQLPADLARAVLIYRQALNHEQCVAAFELGQMFELGEGVSQSLDEAARLYTLARRNKHPEAFIALKRIGRAPE